MGRPVRARWTMPRMSGPMCELTAPVAVQLPNDGTAPGLARRFLRSAVCAPHQAGVLDEAELLTSELVTNAVRYGAPPMIVRVTCDRSRGLVVAVTDGSTQPPAPRQAASDDDSGRGLQLVDLLSSDWGVQASSAGKTVWFELRTK